MSKNNCQCCGEGKATCYIRNANAASSGTFLPDLACEECKAFYSMLDSYNEHQYEPVNLKGYLVQLVRGLIKASEGWYFWNIKKRLEKHGV